VCIPFEINKPFRGGGMSNLYRPQYAFETPRGFRDETFHYSFDKTNVAALGVLLPTLQLRNDIILQFQNDQEFVCRAIRVLGAVTEQGGGTPVSNLYIWLKDPFGNYLSQTYVPISRYLTGAGAGIIGRLPVIIEPEIICPAGGMWAMYLYNPTTGSLLPPSITFFGVKRYPLEPAA
jgi:hypothetical protein